MVDATPHHDHAREFVGQLILATASEVREVSWLPDDSLHDPALGFVYRAARWCATHQADTYSAESVLEQVQRFGTQRDTDTLVDLVGVAIRYAGLPWLAQRLASDLSIRKVQTAAMRIQQITASNVSDEEKRLLLATEAQQIMEHSLAPGPGTVSGLHRVTDFLALASPNPVWLVPDLIGRGERWMVLGVPGSGKSVLARQVCLALAAGMHPLFSSVRIAPRRTLMVDLENPADLLRGEFHRQQGQIGLRADEDSHDRSWLWHKPGGIDLASPADLREFNQVIDQVQPDLVALSPIYKSHSAVGEWEQLAAIVTSAVDSVRARSDCTFWMEHHASKAGTTADRLDPFGSSRWTRWPDFVISLLRDPGEDDSRLPSSLRMKVQKARDWKRRWPERLDRTDAMSWSGYYPYGVN